MNKKLDNVLVRYLQLCEAFRNSEIWSDEAKKSIDYYHTYNVEDGCPILDIIKPLDWACDILKEIKEGMCLISDRYKEVHKIADEVWYFLGEKAYIRDNTSIKEVCVNKDVIRDLVSYFDRINVSIINKTFLIDISGDVWEELGGDGRINLHLND